MPDDPPEEPPLLMPELAPELIPEDAPELAADELPIPELPLVPSVELIAELDMPLDPGLDDEPAPLLVADGLPPPDEREYRGSSVVTHVSVGVPPEPVV